MAFRRKISNVIYLTKFIFKYGKKYFFFIIFGAITQAIMLYTEISVVAAIINSVSISDFKNALILCILYCVLMLLCSLYSDFSYYYYPLLAAQVSKSMNVELLNKSKEIDFSCFDDPDFYNAHTRASSETDIRVQGLIGTYIAFVHNLFSIITISVLLSQTNFYCLLIVFVSVAISTFISLKRGSVGYNFNNEATIYRRKMNYIKSVAFNPNCVIDIRVFGFFDFLKNKYIGYYSDYYQALKKSNVRRELPRMLESITTYIALFLNMFIAVSQVKSGAIVAGAFMSTVLATTNLKTQLGSFFMNFSSFNEHALFAENIRTFFERDPVVENNRQSKDVLSGPLYSIEFDNVSFKYPSSDCYVLKNVSFVLEKDKKYAFVGENGAGKTTIVKLLLRLYDPTEGRVLINGHDLRKFDINSYRLQISTVLQSSNLYEFSVKDNVCFGNDDVDVEYCLSKAGMLDKVNSFDEKINQTVGRSFDKNGAVFSGGEYQKLGIAKSFAKHASVRIYDEPSSALDPLSEVELIRTLESMDRGCISVVISHRLSMTKNSDTIFYVSNGIITEHGSHKELLNQGGYYARAYRAQAEQYSNEQ